MKENLKLINGNISVQSQKGIGSTFTIELPIIFTTEDQNHVLKNEV